MPSIDIGTGAPYAGRLSIGRTTGDPEGTVMFDREGASVLNITREQAHDIVFALFEAFPDLAVEWTGPLFDETPEQAELKAASEELAFLLRNWRPLKRPVVERFLNASDAS